MYPNEIVSRIHQASDAHQKQYPNSPLYAAFDFDNTCILNDLGDLAFFYQLRTGFYPQDPEYILSLLPDLPYKLPLKDLLIQTMQAKGSDAHLRSTDAHLRSTGAKPFEWMVRAYLDFCSIDERNAYVFYVQMHKGNALQEVLRWADEVVEQELNLENSWETLHDPFFADPVTLKHGFTVNSQTDFIIRYLLSQKIPVIIVSGSMTALVSSFVRRVWDIPQDHIFGMNAEVIDGIVTGNVVPPITYKEGKVAKLQQIHDTPPFMAIGDSNTDYPMLCYASSLKLVIDRQVEPFMTDVRSHQSKEDPWHILSEILE